MQNPIHQLFGLLNQSWWLEILAASPSCSYYFGPFDSEDEAVNQQLRYVEDVERKGHEVLLVSVVRRSAPEKPRVEYSEIV